MHIYKGEELRNKNVSGINKNRGIIKSALDPVVVYIIQRIVNQKFDNVNWKKCAAALNRQINRVNKRLNSNH